MHARVRKRLEQGQEEIWVTNVKTVRIPGQRSHCWRLFSTEHMCSSALGPKPTTGNHVHLGTCCKMCLKGCANMPTFKLAWPYWHVPTSFHILFMAHHHNWWSLWPMSRLGRWPQSLTCTVWPLWVWMETCATSGNTMWRAMPTCNFASRHDLPKIYPPAFHTLFLAHHHGRWPCWSIAGLGRWPQSLRGIIWPACVCTEACTSMCSDTWSTVPYVEGPSPAHI